MTEKEFCEILDLIIERTLAGDIKWEKFGGPDHRVGAEIFGYKVFIDPSSSHYPSSSAMRLFINNKRVFTANRKTMSSLSIDKMFELCRIANPTDLSFDNDTEKSLLDLKKDLLAAKLAGL